MKFALFFALVALPLALATTEAEAVAEPKPLEHFNNIKPQHGMSLKQVSNLLQREVPNPTLFERAPQACPSGTVPCQNNPKLCVKPGLFCCNDSKTACQSGGQCCYNGTTVTTCTNPGGSCCQNFACDKGQTCCGPTGCAPVNSICCGNGSCPNTYKCCTGTSGCAPMNATCCSNGSYCPAGTICCPDKTGKISCYNRTSCPST